MTRHTFRAYFWRAAIVALGAFWTAGAVIAAHEFHAGRVAKHIEQEIMSGAHSAHSARSQKICRAPSNVADSSFDLRAG